MIAFFVDGSGICPEKIEFYDQTEYSSGCLLLSLQKEVEHSEVIILPGALFLINKRSTRPAKDGGVLFVGSFPADRNADQGHLPQLGKVSISSSFFIFEEQGIATDDLTPLEIGFPLKRSLTEVYGDYGPFSTASSSQQTRRL